MKFAEKKIFWKSKRGEIIFFDKKKLNFNGPDRCQYYWHNFQKDPGIFKKRVGGGGSVMV